MGFHDLLGQPAGFAAHHNAIAIFKGGLGMRSRSLGAGEPQPLGGIAGQKVFPVVVMGGRELFPVVQTRPS